MDPGLLWGRSEVDVRSIRGRSEVDVRSIFGRFAVESGINPGSVWGRPPPPTSSELACACLLTRTAAEAGELQDIFDENYKGTKPFPPGCAPPLRGIPDGSLEMQMLHELVRAKVRIVMRGPLVDDSYTHLTPETSVGHFLRWSTRLKLACSARLGLGSTKLGLASTNVGLCSTKLPRFDSNWLAFDRNCSRSDHL